MVVNTDRSRRRVADAATGDTRLGQHTGRVEPDDLALPSALRAPQHGWFRRFAELVAGSLGKPTAFVSAAALVVLWAASGPFFHFSDSWQMVINTGTTIITFLMVFLLQSSQRRDSRAIHLKLNELLRAVEQARNTIVAVESLPDDRLDALHSEFVALSAEERQDDLDPVTAP